MNESLDYNFRSHVKFPLLNIIASQWIDILLTCTTLFSIYQLTLLRYEKIQLPAFNIDQFV